MTKPEIAARIIAALEAYDEGTLIVHLEEPTASDVRWLDKRNDQLLLDDFDFENIEFTSSWHQAKIDFICKLMDEVDK